METNSLGNRHRPVKVLQVVYSMDRGGVETWLMHVLRNIDRERYSIDFMIRTDEAGDYGEELRDLHCGIHNCCSPARPWRYAREFEAILRKNGPYDVVHTHADITNGPVMAISKQVGIPIRITHSHVDMSQWMLRDVLQRIFVRRSVRVSRRNATHGFACSDLAASSYFGDNWRSDPRWMIMSYGEELSTFREEVKSDALRDSLGLPRDAYVVGHVGSFRDRQKNHVVFVNIAKEVSRVDSQIVFLLVGDGKLRSSIENQVIEAGLKDSVFFAGVRSDVPQIMLGAMDSFLFPSLYEGQPVALMEAQAAGLPCICSDVIAEEADVVPELINRVALTQSPGEWARVILDVRKSERVISRGEALSMVEKSPFNISTSIKTLEAVYSG